MGLGQIRAKRCQKDLKLVISRYHFQGGQRSQCSNEL